MLKNKYLVIFISLLITACNHHSLDSPVSINNKLRAAIKMSLEKVSNLHSKNLIIRYDLSEFIDPVTDVRMIFQKKR